MKKLFSIVGLAATLAIGSAVVMPFASVAQAQDKPAAEARKDDAKPAEAKAAAPAASAPAATPAAGAAAATPAATPAAAPAASPALPAPNKGDSPSCTSPPSS